jgi:hypothetical protein
MTSVAVVLAIAGILFVFAGLTGAAVWHDGKVTAYLKTTRLRLGALVLGLSFLGSGIYLEVSKEQKKLTADDVKSLLKPIEDSIRQQKESLLKIETENGGQQKGLDTLFEKVRAVDSSLTRAFAEQHDNLFQTGQLLAQHNKSLGCAKSDAHYENPNWGMPSSDLCDQISALGFNIAIYLDDKRIEAFREKFVALGLHAAIAEKQKYPFYESDLAIIFPDHTPKDLVCLIHEQYRKQSIENGYTTRVIPFLLSIKTLNDEITEQPDTQSRKSILLGWKLEGAGKRIRPMDENSWVNLCNKNSKEDLEDYVRKRILPRNQADS